MPRVLPIAQLAALILGQLAAPTSGQNIVADIPLAGGGSERALLAGPTNPPAILVMLAGGDGIVEISNSGAITRLGGNFLLRTQALWLGKGWAVTVLGPPNGASLLGQRHTPAYADAISRAADFARTRANAPVWLVGTSQGSTAAANGAAHLGHKVAGVVLSSSVTGQNNSGETVFDSEPGAIVVPALIVANQGDTCPSTPAADANTIAAALSRSPRKEVVYVQSDQTRSPPCEAMSPHGYFGIEAEVVQRISDWIRAASAR
jgi:pimeloyl-ACP methyl ester carboxylesterase